MKETYEKIPLIKGLTYVTEIVNGKILEIFRT